MKKFRFRLEPLLKAKEHAEKERQKELAKVLHQIKSRQEALTELSKSRADTLASQRRDSIGSLSPSALLVHSRFLLRLKGQELSDKEIIKELESKAMECRQRLETASKEKKIFEKLKEKQFESHRFEHNKAENEELEEISIMAFGRQNRGEVRS